MAGERLIHIVERASAKARAFPAPSLMCCLAELKRERKMRERTYPRLIERGIVTEDQAMFQNRCLDGAIDTLESMLAGQRSEVG